MTVAEKIFRDAIGNAEDDLYRAKMQMRAMPTYVSGNGDTIESMVQAYQKGVDEIKAEAKRLGVELPGIYR